MQNEFDEISGELEFTIYIPPVSQQAKSKYKNILKREIHKALAETPYIFLGDVSIIITQFTNEERKYLSATSPDTDNIIKPIIDALCGTRGIMIDDVQLQHVECYWLDINKESLEFISIDIRSDPWQKKLKEELIFFQLNNEIYLPFPLYKTGDLVRVYDYVIEAYKRDDQLEESYKGISSGLIGFPKFHISRVCKSGFPYYKKEDIRNFLLSVKQTSD